MKKKGKEEQKNQKISKDK